VSEVIACANQKGGVGKTTTVVSLASYLALDGHRVLIVDLDPQGNATSGSGLDKRSVERSVYDALIGASPLAALVCATRIDGLSIVPSSRDLSGAEVELVGLPDREQRLARALAPLAGEYDYILLDCPPSLGLLTVNALAAADSVLVPIQCEYYALEGLGQLLSTIDLVRDRINPSLHVKGVVLTMFDGRTTLSADVSAEVHRHLGALVFDVVVPRSVRLAEAPSYGRPIPLYSPSSRGAQAYRDLAAEFIARGTGASRQDPSATAPRPARPPAWVTSA
jgi:chromosome partitioning protein